MPSCHPALRKCVAFTLAELLITLGIIGIVAALTLPSVLSNIEKKRNVTILKRAYSDLNKYVQDFSYQNDCDNNFANCVPEDGEFVNKFATYLSEKQNFKYGHDITSDTGSRVFVRVTDKNTCDNNNCLILGLKNTNYNGIHYLISPTGTYAYFIENYMYDNFYRFQNKDVFRAKIGIATNLKSIELGWFWPKTSKLQYGKNYFEAYITQLHKIPVNGNPLCASDGYYCQKMKENDCTKGNDYKRCFQKIIEDGWEIKYDY